MLPITQRVTAARHLGSTHAKAHPLEGNPCSTSTTLPFGCSPRRPTASGKLVPPTPISQEHSAGQTNQVRHNRRASVQSQPPETFVGLPHLRLVSEGPDNTGVEAPHLFLDHLTRKIERGDDVRTI
jgi:hypothetical protein